MLPSKTGQSSGRDSVGNTSFILDNKENSAGGQESWSKANFGLRLHMKRNHMSYLRWTVIESVPGRHLDDSKCLSCPISIMSLSCFEPNGPVSPWKSRAHLFVWAEALAKCLWGSTDSVLNLQPGHLCTTSPPALSRWPSQCLVTAAISTSVLQLLAPIPVHICFNI